MDAEKIKEYLSEVPFEIRNAIKPLDNDKTWAILIALLKNERMRFTDLKSAFKTDSSGDIDRYLKLLITAGLIDLRVEVFKDITHTERSEYYPTEMSKSLIRALFRGILIQPEEHRYRSSVVRSKQFRYQVVHPRGVGNYSTQVINQEMMEIDEVAA